MAVLDGDAEGAVLPVQADQLPAPSPARSALVVDAGISFGFARQRLFRPRRVQVVVVHVESRGDGGEGEGACLTGEEEGACFERTLPLPPQAGAIHVEAAALLLSAATSAHTPASTSAAH